MSIRILDHIKVLCYLKSQSPNNVSRKDLADRFFEGKLKKVDSVCGNLIECNLVSSRSGTNGGYYYDPQPDLNGLKDKELEALFNGFTYINQEELNDINLFIDEDKNLERFSSINLGGAPMIKNLKTNNYNITENEKEIMNNITDAIRKKYKLRINYTKSVLDKDGYPEKFECVIAPINFTVYNGLVYLNLIYYHYHNGKPTNEESLRAWIVSKIEILEHLENQKFEVSEDFKEKIKNRFPYEISEFDKETIFPIKIKFEGYNTFNRTFKNYYYDKINLDKPYSIVEIKTKSYWECVNNLLSLGNTFEFKEKEKSKPVRELYFRKLENLLSDKNITETEKETINELNDAIRNKYKLKIKYKDSKLDENGIPKSYKFLIAPISFINYNGSAYLNLYKYSSSNKDEKELCTWLISKIEILNHLKNEKFKIDNKDFERINNKLPYEINEFNEEITFPIKVKYEGYNLFNRTFKHYYNDKLELDKPYSIVEIKTRSYKECYSNLLSLKNTFEFLEKEKSKPVRDLYFKNLEELLRKRDN